MQVNSPTSQSIVQNNPNIHFHGRLKQSWKVNDNGKEYHFNGAIKDQLLDDANIRGDLYSLARIEEFHQRGLAEQKPKSPPWYDPEWIASCTSKLKNNILKLNQAGKWFNLKTKSGQRTLDDLVSYLGSVAVEAGKEYYCDRAESGSHQCIDCDRADVNIVFRQLKEADDGVDPDHIA